jgi:ATP-dependent 26S proteasome regulatory subunit
LEEIKDDFIKELSDLFQAKVRYIGITTIEEQRVIPDIIHAFNSVYSEENDVVAKKYAYSQSSGLGEINDAGRLIDEYDAGRNTVRNDIGLLDFINNVYHEMQTVKKANLIICKEFNTITDFGTMRYMRDLNSMVTKNCYCPVVIIAPSFKLMPSIQKMFRIVKYTPPDEELIKQMIEGLQDKAFTDITKLTEEETEQVIIAAKGLTFQEIKFALRLSYIKHKKFIAKELLDEKIQIIKKSGVLSYKEPELTLDDIGGHKILKQWIKDTKTCMSKEAAAFGVDRTRGFISTGLAGSGKTAVAEAIAKYFGMPLIVFDLSKIMGGIVGESERQATQAFDIIDSLGGCVILVDESEKVLGGAKSSNNSDGGTMSRVLSIFLNRMNSNTKDFYIFTSNNMADLPPELTRSGRLDIKWFFDYPNEEERKEIFKIHFGKRKHKDINKNLIARIAQETEHYTGAEIEQTVKNALKNAYIRSLTDNKLEVMYKDLEKGKNEVSTIFTTNKAAIEKMLQNAKTNGLKRTSSDAPIEKSSDGAVLYDSPEKYFASLRQQNAN